MAQQNTFNTLNGDFKEAYADGVQMAVPDGVKLLKEIDFVPSQKETGNLFHQPVLLGNELGITFGGPTSGVFSLNNSIAAIMQDAQVRGNQMLMRTQMGYDAAARASDSGKKAFLKATEFPVKNLAASRAKFTEMVMWYGASPSGLASLSGAASVTGATTRRVLTIGASQWAPGNWAGMAGLQLDSYQDASLLNANATVSVTAVDIANRLIHVTGNSTDLQAIDDAAATANIQLHLRGAYGNQMSGIDAIAMNTGSIFNINATTYDLWAATRYSAGDADISLSKILKSLVGPVNKGLEESVKFYFNPNTWTKLATDFAALRRYDSSYSTKKLENGTEALCIYGINGLIEIEPSIYIKEGEGFGLPLKQFQRIGSTDWTFNLPGRGDEFFLHVPDYNAFEIRTYTDQALFCKTPAKVVKITNIVNS